jgi:hypothetical protein
MAPTIAAATEAVTARSAFSRLELSRNRSRSRAGSAVTALLLSPQTAHVVGVSPSKGAVDGSLHPASTGSSATKEKSRRSVDRPEDRR